MQCIILLAGDDTAAKEELHQLLSNVKDIHGGVAQINADLHRVPAEVSLIKLQLGRY